jgi:putative ABC transport system permease protein
VLAESGIPTRVAASIRARVLVSDGGATVRVASARFADAAFFTLFRLPIEGRAFNEEEQARGEPVVVLGARLARVLTRGRPDAPVMIEGRPFRVVGVVAGDQVFRPDWDPPITGGPQDALYLPRPFLQRMLARPESLVHQTPFGPRHDDLLASDAVFVTLWLELTTPEQRAAYTRFLDQRFASRGIAYTLRSYPEWQAAFPVPDSSIRFFAMLAGFVLLASGFNMARLFMAKGLARREELGIHRALGASRGSLFVRLVLEASLLSAPAAFAGVLISLVFHAAYNRLVEDNDIPIGVTALGFLVSVGAALLTGTLAALYPAWRVSRTRPTVYLGRG